MIKKILILLLFPFCLLSQDIEHLFLKNGEVYFSFKYKNKEQLDKLSKIISIDHKTNAEVAYAYANKKEFSEFLKKDIIYQIIEKKPIYFTKDKSSWNYYPSYQEYIDMMQAFADSFPNICKLHNLGTLNSGRKILIVQISDNVGKKENEPSFLYTSSMHGDELAGYVLMLRLIHELLNNYGSNNRITNLVNEVDIWINPLANPDGAYAGGNQDVSNAMRYNASWVDLNRNYPDPQDGMHPDGNSWQQETKIFMGLADSINFSLAANLHGGTELVNYPWDTWGQATADENWWEHVSNEYAQSCQSNSSSGYFNSQNNGITNGFAWYEVDGGRQDYMNYFKHCREFTLELSDDKIPNPSQLPVLWNANYNAFLSYMEQSLYGLRGVVTDSIYGFPLKAKIEIISHDTDSSHIYSNLPIGNYHRYLYQGNYNITFSKAGYYSKIINVNITNQNTEIKDIQLVPLNFVATNKDLKINEKKLMKVINVLGIDTFEKKSSILFYIYNDGTSEKRIIID